MDYNKEDIGAFFVKVRETRPVSDEIAEELDVRHESPQIFLVKDRKQIWNTSHSQITEDSIREALANN